MLASGAMDLITMAFYAVICGVLGVSGPWLGKPWVRFGIGAVTGIVASTLLPALRGLAGI